MFEIQKLCCGCSACVSVCPKDCLTLKRDSDGFYRPVFCADNCIDCDLCKRACPLLCQPKKNDNVLAYGAVAKDGDIRLSSSSGGVFTVLATEIINKGGVVFGAAFDKDFSVHHQAAFSVEEAKCFRGSKYVQSYMGNCYTQIKEMLDEDRWVYFSGTPCQVAGLISFLNKRYDKLITQDFICHSVPSPLVWDAYKAFRQAEAGGKITSVSFRAKEVGIKGYKLKIDFDNGESYTCGGDDPYTTAFIQGLSSQDSCYNCKFKGLHRVSDITLADFWGVEEQCPKLDSTDGTSLILLHSDKGKTLFDSVKEKISCVEANTNIIFDKNQMAIKSVYKSTNRKAFFKVLKNKGFEKAYKKATSEPIKVKLKRFFK